MEMRAYYEDYLAVAQRILGDMMDFAINTCDIDADAILKQFVVSGIAEQFEKGNPRFVAGVTGCELARQVCADSYLMIDSEEDVMYLDKSPEYWAGWALCYYQWYTAKSFSRIHKMISMNELLAMYPTLHEADIQKFVDIMENRWDAYYKESRLKQIREMAGFSQAELARASGVCVRQIQLFEQGQRDINKTQFQTVLKLSKALGCAVEDLAEL